MLINSEEEPSSTSLCISEEIFARDVRTLKLLSYLSKESVKCLTVVTILSDCLVLTMPLEDDLASAAATGNTDRVQMLLESGVDVNGVNSFGRTPLQVMMMGSTSVAQLLLQQGADPNVADRHTGTTPLHDAARMGFLDTVKILVQFNANPNTLDNRQCRPIDLAEESEHQQVVEFLQTL